MAIKNRDILNEAKQNPTIRYALYAVYVAVIIAIVYVVLQIVKGAHQAAAVVGEVATDKVTATKLGIDPARVSFIRELSSSMWNDSTHRDPFKLFFGFSYDTGSIEAAVNEMTSQTEVVLLNNYYKQLGGNSLRDVITWLHGFGSISDAGSNIDPSIYSYIEKLP